MNENSSLSKKEKRELKRREKEEAILNNHKNKKIKIWSLWLTIFLILAAGIGSIVFLVSKKPNFNAAVSQPALLALTKDDWIKGAPNAKAELIEYSDLECPACAAFNPVLEKLSNDFPNDFKLVYRHFPLPQHGNAKAAAYAAEAAGRQGKFFEMASKIFESQTEWESLPESVAKDKFKNIAPELGLDLNKFQNDLNDSSIKNSVQRDLDSGNALGINSTPTFFLNNKKIQNPRSYEEFKKLIENEINNGQK